MNLGGSGKALYMNFSRTARQGLTIVSTLACKIEVEQSSFLRGTQNQHALPLPRLRRAKEGARTQAGRQRAPKKVASKSISFCDFGLKKVIQDSCLCSGQLVCIMFYLVNLDGLIS